MYRSSTPRPVKSQTVDAAVGRRPARARRTRRSPPRGSIRRGRAAILPASHIGARESTRSSAARCRISGSSSCLPGESEPTAEMCVPGWMSAARQQRLARSGAGDDQAGLARRPRRAKRRQRLRRAAAAPARSRRHSAARSELRPQIQMRRRSSTSACICACRRACTPVPRMPSADPCGPVRAPPWRDGGGADVGEMAGIGEQGHGLAGLGRASSIMPLPVGRPRATLPGNVLAILSAKYAAAAAVAGLDVDFAAVAGGYPGAWAWACRTRRGNWRSGRRACGR